MASNFATPMPVPPFSLVSTVFNEINRLDQTILDLEAQSLRPNEIVVTDAGSADGTWQRLERWRSESAMKITLLQMPGCNIAQGRNEAIRIARNELIASTDFGCRYHPDWLLNLIKPFGEYPEIELVGGAFGIVKEDVKTRAARADFILQNGYPMGQDEYFSVSSRSIAYYRPVWQRLGGYLEWLTLAADDTIFWRMAKRAQVRYRLDPFQGVFWLRHKTFKAFSREAFRYGLGDGESLINFRNFLSTCTETKLRWAFFILILACFLWWEWKFRFAILFFLILISPFAFRSYRRAIGNWQGLRGQGYGWMDLLAAFYLTELSRIQYLYGYVKGWLFSPARVKQERQKLGALPV